MEDLTFDALTDETKRRIQAVEAERTFDGQLVIVVRDGSGGAAAMAKVPFPENWDKAQNYVEAVLNKYGLGSGGLLPVAPRFWLGKAGLIDSWRF